MAWAGWPLVWILGLVVVQRLAELVLATRNTRRLLARGGREVGAGHYPLFILLHASWLIAIALATPPRTEPYWPLIGAFALLQLARVWVIATLGPYWTTRVITVDDAPVVRAGPYRLVRHPNYWVVTGEIAILPLAFHDWAIALVWSILNALLLRHRIRVETMALAPRTPLPGTNALAAD
ncbi:MAG TPA: isoprenylcysteine carboxylmethyltransferase family protein [Caulobacteraceae bacterium]|nr:isoprenylcysteine carboxylmethyltransferase family protein [Caulobacteraceae bacterium]